MKTVLVTGSSGLIGSEVSAHFAANGWQVHGVDNHARATFLGPNGDTRWNGDRLRAELRAFQHHELDVRDRPGVLRLVDSLNLDAVVHCAAQPSHDFSARMPFDDFDTNAGGTMNLLEALRRSTPESTFVHLSTNKVYGDAPNELPLEELATRWDYARAEDHSGVGETLRIDRSKHSPFGASKLAADIMVQEYGRYFGMNTCCLRAGCVTGPNHSGVELHGFVSHLVKCNLTGQRYTVYGYKGKQVRDNIHALDIARFAYGFVLRPRVGEVYNLGGGRANSCSILEAFERIRACSGKKMVYDYTERNREGDHICYITDFAKAKTHYPAWTLTMNLDAIFEDVYLAWRRRLMEV